MKKFMMPVDKLDEIKRLIRPDVRKALGNETVFNEIEKLFTYNEDNWNELSDIVRASK